MAKRKEDTKEAETKADAAACPYACDSMVWARHGPLIYLAKVLKVKTDKNETHLFVHYNKWNKKWDTWVNANEVLENSPKTEEIAKTLQAKVKLEKENKGKRRLSTKEVQDSDDEVLVKEGKENGSAKKRSRIVAMSFCEPRS